MTKIMLKGKAGQGIQLLGFLLANILKDQDYNVTIINEYSALVRSGKSTSNIIFSKEQIKNPLIENNDIEVDLSEEKLQEKLLTKFNNPKVINMVLLGVLLKKLGLTYNKKHIEKYLPNKFLDNNLKAIENGYN